MWLLPQCAGTLLRDAMMSLRPSEAAATDLTQDDAPHHSLMAFVAAWYQDVAARDARNLGVSIAGAKYEAFAGFESLPLVDLRP